MKPSNHTLARVLLCGAMVCAIAMQPGTMRGQHATAARQNDVTAIDILLEPDAAMLKHAEANNARLLAVFPKGFALDATHRPHITLVQRFVRTADLDKVYAAAGRVFTDANVNSMKLEAFKYYYTPAGAVGVAGICAKPTPEILEAPGGHYCRRKAVYGGNWPHWRVHRSPGRCCQ